MDLYLILIGTAALGILALILIFWDSLASREKPQNQRPTNTGQPIEILETKDIKILVEPSAAEKRASHKRIDPILASMGFSALDDLLEETKSSPQVLPSVICSTEKSEVGSNLQASKILEKEIIIFYLLAPAERLFVGYELMQTLLAAGLRFGPMNIFHYYPDEDEDQPYLFSVSSAVEPGIFDLTSIGGYSCPGLSLFLSTTSNRKLALNCLLDIAIQLAEELDGILCDENRLPLQEETIAEYREVLEML